MESERRSFNLSILLPSIAIRVFYSLDAPPPKKGLRFLAMSKQFMSFSPVLPLKHFLSGIVHGATSEGSFPSFTEPESAAAEASGHHRYHAQSGKSCLG